MAKKSGKFDFMSFATNLAAMTAGGIVAKQLDPLLGKLPGGPYVANAAKIAAGGAVGYFVQNDLGKAAGMGMAVQGSYGLVAQFIPKIAGVGGVGYAGSALPNYNDEVIGEAFPEGDVIGQAFPEGDVIGDDSTYGPDSMPYEMRF